MFSIGSYTGESNNDEMQASKSDSNDKPAAMSDSNADDYAAYERHMDNPATRFGTVARRSEL